MPRKGIVGNKDGPIGRNPAALPSSNGAAPFHGLVRGVDRRARRHVYGVGDSPAGEIVGELGGLAGRPQEGSVPVWLSSDGRLVTEGMPPRRRPSVRAVLQWVLEPTKWVDDDWTPRMRAIARRIEISLRMLSRGYPRPARRSGDPVGYLNGGGPGHVPLYGALHPVTGDQLLTTVATEAERLGYEGAALLGHLAATAPVTGALGVAPVDLAWVARSREQPKARRPQGAIDSPRPGESVSRQSFTVIGWALWPPEPVARVEIAIDGVPAGRARLGLPRSDIASRHHLLTTPEASICGFEFRVAPSDLPVEAAEVSIDAVMIRTDGERFRCPLPPSRSNLHPSASRTWTGGPLGCAPG